MSGPGPSNLTVNERGPDQNWFGPTAINRDAYRNWTRSKNKIEEIVTVTPSDTTAAFGSTTLIEWDRRGDMMGECTLQYTRAAVTASGRFLNFFYQLFFQAKLMFDSMTGKFLPLSSISKLSMKTRVFTNYWEIDGLST